MAPKKKTAVKKTVAKKLIDEGMDFNIDEDNSQEVLEQSKGPTDTKKHELIEELKGVVNDDKVIDADDWTEESLEYVIKKVKYDKQARKELRENVSELESKILSSDIVEDIEEDLDEEYFEDGFDEFKPGIDALGLGHSKGSIFRMYDGDKYNYVFVPTVDKIIVDHNGEPRAV